MLCVILSLLDGKLALMFGWDTCQGDAQAKMKKIAYERQRLTRFDTAVYSGQTLIEKGNVDGALSATGPAFQCARFGHILKEAFFRPKFSDVDILALLVEFLGTFRAFLCS